MQTSSKSSKKSVFKFYQTLGKVTIAVFLPMDKLEQENRIQWSVMEPIKY